MKRRKSNEESNDEEIRKKLKKYSFQFCSTCENYQNNFEKLCEEAHQNCISHYISLHQLENLSEEFHLSAKHGQISFIIDWITLTQFDILQPTWNGKSLLQSSIENNKLNDVKKLLEISEKPFTIDPSSLKLSLPHPQILFELIKQTKQENLSLLLSSSINEAILNKNDESLLLLLSFLYPQSKLIQNSKEEEEERKKKNISAVHLAVGMGYTKGLEILLNFKFSSDYQFGEDKVTPMHIASSKGHVDCLRLLLHSPSPSHLSIDNNNNNNDHNSYNNNNNNINHNNNVNNNNGDENKTKENEDKNKKIKGGEEEEEGNVMLKETEQTGLLPIHLATLNGHLQCVKVLIEEGKNDVNGKSSKNGMTSLHYAAASGNLEMIRYLIGRGADVTIREFSGNSPLLYAAHCSHFLCGKEIAKKCFANDLKKWIYLSLIAEDVSTKLLVTRNNSSSLSSSSPPPSPSSSLSSLFELKSEIEKYRKTTRKQREEKGKEEREGEKEEERVPLFIIKKKMPLLMVEYEGEMGKGPGVLREWINQIALSFSQLSLFTTYDNRRSFYPSPLRSFSSPSPIENEMMERMEVEMRERKEMCRVIGYFLGLIIANCLTIPFRFCSPVYSAMIGERLKEEDLLFVDKDYYINTFCFIRDLHTEEEISDLDIRFSYLEEFGDIVDLIENGRNISVTMENKEVYLQLLWKQRLLGSHRLEMIEQISFGFRDALPSQFIDGVFTAKGLEDSLSGEVNISFSDWKLHTVYSSFSSSNSINSDLEVNNNNDNNDNNIINIINNNNINNIEVNEKSVEGEKEVEWFWEFVEGLEKEKMERLLSFVTGSSILPIGGFKQLKNDFIPFTIGISSNHFPTSCTCTNSLFLPRSTSADELHRKLHYVIDECYSGFGFI